MAEDSEIKMLKTEIAELKRRLANSNPKDCRHNSFDGLEYLGGGMWVKKKVE